MNGAGMEAFLEGRSLTLQEYGQRIPIPCLSVLFVQSVVPTAFCRLNGYGRGGSFVRGRATGGSIGAQDGSVSVGC